MKRVSFLLLIFAAMFPALAFGSLSADVAQGAASFYALSLESELPGGLALRLEGAAAPKLGSPGLQAYLGGCDLRFYPRGLHGFFVEAGGGYLEVIGGYTDEMGWQYGFSAGLPWAGAGAGLRLSPFGAAGPFVEPAVGYRLLFGSLDSKASDDAGSPLASRTLAQDLTGGWRLALALGWAF